MALKDWKTFPKSSPNRQVYKKKGLQLEILSPGYFHTDKAYKVVVFDGLTKLQVNYFATKTQALKYAKSYMRKH